MSALRALLISRLRSWVTCVVSPILTPLSRVPPRLVSSHPRLAELMRELRTLVRLENLRLLHEATAPVHSSTLARHFRNWHGAGFESEAWFVVNIYDHVFMRLRRAGVVDECVLTELPPGGQLTDRFSKRRWFGGLKFEFAMTHHSSCSWFDSSILSTVTSTQLANSRGISIVAELVRTRAFAISYTSSFRRIHVRKDLNTYTVMYDGKLSTDEYACEMQCARVLMHRCRCSARMFIASSSAFAISRAIVNASYSAMP
jgi:hypothetical protein